jgi:nucleotide-binding universal stress UspA family protein
MPVDPRSDKAQPLSAADEPQAPILVAVDFSPDSEAALCWAARHAASLETPLLVLHVVHDPAEAPGYYTRASKKPIERLEDVARSMLDRFLERVGRLEPALSAVPKLDAGIVIGVPEGRILEVAEQENAQLIVMGGRGRTRFADLLLGSKTERVARMARTPVTIVKCEGSGA